MNRYVLDTNIVSFIVKRDAHMVSRFHAEITPDDMFIGCPMVWYEAQRGLLEKGAQSQLKRFKILFDSFEWQDYTAGDWNLATQWWMRRRALGRPIGDADLLIAVFTYNRSAILVTDNEKDYVGLDVIVENWMHDNQ
jgi:predicted nucleic acid-binding protein